MRAITTLKKRRTVPLWMILVTVPVFMALGALCVLWYWNTHKESIIRSKIETAIEEKTDGMYKIRYDSTAMNELEGNLAFYNLHLAYDSAKVLAAEKNGTAPPLLFTIDIPEISVPGVKTTRAMAKNEIVGKKLIIKEPVINLYSYEGKNSDRNLPTEEDYREILSGLKLVEVDTILLSSASITKRNRHNGKMIAEGKNIDITLLNVKIDSAAFEDRTRMMFSKDVNINIGTVKWASDDKLYNFHIGNISMSSANNNMSIAKFTMKPVMGEDAFVRAIPFQDDRLDISLSGVRFSGVDLKKLKEGELQAETMNIPSATLKLYRDLARPRDKKNRIGKYPHQILAEIGMLFSIKRLLVSDAYMEYKERGLLTRQTGSVIMTHVNGVINNISNDKKKRGQEMTAAINCRLLDQAAFSTNWKFNLLDPEGRFHVTGKVGPVNGVILNALTEPLGPAHIREGQLNGLEVALHGNNNSMNGTVKLLYDNLKVDVLEKDKGATETDKKFLTSLLANVIIKNSNPKNNEAARIANVNMIRDSNRSMFWLCWKTIFKGIKETVGIKEGMIKPAASTNTKGK